MTLVRTIMFARSAGDVSGAVGRRALKSRINMIGRGLVVAGGLTAAFFHARKTAWR